MISIIPLEITIGSFSLIGILTGYIWNTHNKRISQIEKVQSNRPCVDIERIIVELRTDIKWIKQKLNR